MPFAFFTDASLTATAVNVAVTRPATGEGYVDRMVYLGSTTAGKLLEAASDPGVDPVVVSVTDTTPGGGVQAAHVKLAVVQDDLDTAEAGVPLELGAMIMSGTGSCAGVWLRIATPALTAGVYSELTLTTNAVVEVDDV